MRAYTQSYTSHARATQSLALFFSANARGDAQIRERPCNYGSFAYILGVRTYYAGLNERLAVPSPRAILSAEERTSMHTYVHTYWRAAHTAFALKARSRMRDLDVIQGTRVCACVRVYAYPCVL